MSEPPVRVKSDTPSRPPTFADVAMKIAHDGPAYCLIALVGAMAIKGNATAAEVVITGLGSLLSRSWPRAVQLTGTAVVAMFYLGQNVESFVYAATQ